METETLNLQTNNRPKIIHIDTSFSLRNNYSAHHDLENLMDDYSRGLKLDSALGSKKQDLYDVNYKLIQICNTLRGYGVRTSDEGKSKAGTLRRTWSSRIDYLENQLSSGEDTLRSTLQKAVENRSMTKWQAQESIRLIYKMLDSAITSNKYLNSAYGKEKIEGRKLNFIRAAYGATEKLGSSVSKIHSVLDMRIPFYASDGLHSLLSNKKRTVILPEGFVAPMDPGQIYTYLKHEGLGRPEILRMAKRNIQYVREQEKKDRVLLSKKVLEDSTRKVIGAWQAKILGKIKQVPDRIKRAAAVFLYF